ncbi:prohibitin family protein [Lyngbya confervoides]|uniref:Prohibitin family protein n=1 Tax=Lyngbya confervoides BDU141951 TaxID=1574623 RepID=A0ABD4T5V6_9CYAN|nr:prohibitin family protein [Lyngbya confervoides]MCM1983831.1 prohibitin family protein [Lyngbya confervoides BDU141951]
MEPNTKLLRLLPLVIGLIILLLLQPVTLVGPGERGVVTHFGAVDPRPLNEGLHVVVPLRDRVVILDVKVQKHEVPAKGSTKDLQDLKAVFAVNFALRPDTIAQTFQQQGNLGAIVERIVAPQTQESFKTAVAQFTAEESIVKRPQLKENFDQILSDRLDKYGIDIYDTSVVDILFSNEFAQAVERKQVAEQEAQRAIYIAKKAEQEAQARVNQATGEAEAQRLLQQSLTPAILRKQELDNQRLAIEKWDGQLPGVNSGALPFLEIAPDDEETNRYGGGAKPSQEAL